MQKSTTSNFQETQKLGENFAAEILARDPQKNATVLALQGDLGAGKTTFLQGFAKGLGIKEIVNSPTFVIMKKFELKNNEFKYFYHFDCYRLNNYEEILHLGFKEIIADPKNIVAIEWPEKLGDLLPQNAIKISFEHLSEDERELTIN